MTAAVRQTPRAVALSLSRVAILAGGVLAMKIGVKSCPPFTLTCIRFAIAAVGAWALARLAGGAWPPRKSDWVRTCVLGVLQVVIPTTLLCTSLKYSSAGTASIVYATQPLALAVLASRLLGEKLTRLRGLGLLLGFGGVVFTMTARIGAGGKHDSPLGVAMTAGAVVCLVGSTIFFKRFPSRCSPLPSISIQYGLGALLLLPVALIFEQPWAGNVSYTGSGIGSLAYLIIFSSILGQLVWQVMLAKGEASVFTSYFFLTPIFGLGLASIFLSEKISSRDYIGLGGAVVGIMIIARAPPG